MTGEYHWADAPEHYREAVRINDRAARKRETSRSPKDIVTCYDAAQDALINANRAVTPESLLAIGKFVRRFGL